MQKNPLLALAVFFLGIIFSVPMIQIFQDLQAGELPRLFELFQQAPTEKRLREFEKNIEQGLIIRQNLGAAYRLLGFVVSQDLGPKALSGSSGWLFYQPDVDYLIQPYFREDPNWLPEGGDPIEVIRDFARQLQSRGIQLLLVPVPSKVAIYPEKLSRSFDSPSRPSLGPTDRFIQELSGSGLEVLRVGEGLLLNRREFDNRSEPLFMATDTHWTGRGIRIVARLIAERIRQQPWYLEYPKNSSYLRRSVSVRRWGDILHLTQLPLRDKFFSPETVLCDQVWNPETKVLYQDDPNSPILLLGDSFSRVFQTDEPGSAGLGANLAYELRLPIASIINDGGASTLVRQQLSRNIESLQGKRLVIWEFAERDIRFGLQGWQFISLFEPEPTDSEDP